MFCSVCQVGHETSLPFAILNQMHLIGLLSLFWCFTAPFNNMWTLKFTIQPTVLLFTAVNHCSGPLRKQNHFLYIFIERCNKSFALIPQIIKINGCVCCNVPLEQVLLMLHWKMNLSENKTKTKPNKINSVRL